MAGKRELYLYPSSAGSFVPGVLLIHFVLIKPLEFISSLFSSDVIGSDGIGGMEEGREGVMERRERRVCARERARSRG